MDNQINVALCTDDNYANHCAVCIVSILENNQDADCSIYVLTVGLSVENMAKFQYLGTVYRQKIEVKVLDMALFDQLQITNHLGRAMYFRFMIPNVINASKVLYLDCDIMVRHSLRPLFETDLTDKACGVIEDQCGDDIRLHNPIQMFSRYFNSGVLLMNLDYWREHNSKKTLIEWIEQFPGQLLCPDQDALNKVFENKVVFLDYTYNFQQGFYGNLTWLRADKWDAVKEARKNPVIVHFTAGEKPWHTDCTHPLLSEYDNYRGLHAILNTPKTSGHRWYFYVVEGVIDKLRAVYRWYRHKNGMVVNEV